MLSYQAIVDHYRRHSVREMIPNGSSSHARVLIRALLTFAADHSLDVKIVSGCLAQDIFGDLAALADAILSKNKIEILLERVDSAQLVSNSFFKAVLNSPRGAVSSADAPLCMPHFVLAGSRAYRLEINDNTREAQGNFNDPDIGEWLGTLFQAGSKNATRLDARTWLSSREQVIDGAAQGGHSS